MFLKLLPAKHTAFYSLIYPLDGEFSEPFEVTNGVKQGCVMAPTLFSMMFSAMLMDAFEDSATSFPLRYRFDGKIFNLRRLQAKTKVQTDVLD